MVGSSSLSLSLSLYILSAFTLASTPPSNTIKGQLFVTCRILFSSTSLKVFFSILLCGTQFVKISIIFNVRASFLHHSEYSLQPLTSEIVVKMVFCYFQKYYILLNSAKHYAVRLMLLEIMCDFSFIYFLWRLSKIAFSPLFIKFEGVRSTYKKIKNEPNWYCGLRYKYLTR